MKHIKDNVYLSHFSQMPSYSGLAQVEMHSGECLWNERDFVNLLHEKSKFGCYLLIAAKVGIVGFVVYERRKNHYEILNLVIDPDYRCQGFGTALLNKMKSKLNKTYKYLSFVLRESNTGSHFWLQRNCFVATGVSRDYFRDEYQDFSEREDAYLFQYRKEFDDYQNVKRAGGCPIHVNRTTDGSGHADNHNLGAGRSSS